MAATAIACGDDAPAPVLAPRYVTSFGYWGTGEGEFKYPIDIAVGPDSLLCVLDDGNRRVEAFPPIGEFVRQWPVGDRATLIVVAPDSTVYVHEPYGGGTGRLEEYTSAGEFLGAWGFVNAVGGLEIDASGNLYIYGLRIYGPNPSHPFVDGGYFWKFSPQHELIKKWGYPGPRDTTGWTGGPMIWNDAGNLVVLGSLDTTAAVFEFAPDGNRGGRERVPLCPRLEPVSGGQIRTIAVMVVPMLRAPDPMEARACHPRPSRSRSPGRLPATVAESEAGRTPWVRVV